MKMPRRLDSIRIDVESRELYINGILAECKAFSVDARFDDGSGRKYYRITTEGDGLISISEYDAASMVMIHEGHLKEEDL